MTARALAALVLAALCGLTGGAFAQATGKSHIITTASTNATQECAARCALKAVVAINTNTALGFLHFYEGSGTPNCATTPAWTMPVPFGASGAGDGFAIPLPEGGAGWVNGFGVCVTGGIADGDSTNAPTGIAINFLFQCTSGSC